MNITQPLRIGIGGPVGSGKTALTLSLCRALRERYELAVVTNDIYTEEDAQFLVTKEALPPERVLGAEAGGCPDIAVRDSRRMRGDRPFVFTNLKTGQGVDAVVRFIEERGMVATAAAQGSR